MESPTRDQIVAAFNVVAALAEAIRVLGSVPSGELYARVMGNLSVQAYDSAIDTLIRARLVSKRNNVIAWIGGSL